MIVPGFSSLEMRGWVRRLDFWFHLRSSFLWFESFDRGWKLYRPIPFVQLSFDPVELPGPSWKLALSSHIWLEFLLFRLNLSSVVSNHFAARSSYCSHSILHSHWPSYSACIPQLDQLHNACRNWDISFLYLPPDDSNIHSISDICNCMGRILSQLL